MGFSIEGDSDDAESETSTNPSTASDYFIRSVNELAFGANSAAIGANSV